MARVNNPGLQRKDLPVKGTNEFPSLPAASSTGGGKIVPAGTYTVPVTPISPAAGNGLYAFGDASISQPLPSTSCIIHDYSDPPKSETTVFGLRFSQDASADVTGGNDDHSMIVWRGGKWNRSLFNHFSGGQFAMSFMYGLASLPDRRGMFGQAIGNSGQVDAMFMENLGSANNVAVGNIAYGGLPDKTAFHGIRGSGYDAANGDSTTAKCTGITAAGNVFYRFNNGVSVQNATSLWNMTGMHFDECDYGFHSAKGTSVNNNPTLGLISFTALKAKKAVLCDGVSHSLFDVVAEGSQATTPFIEEVTSAGARGHNRYRGILRGAGNVGVQLRYSHNTVDLTVDGTNGTAVAISGAYNSGSVVIDNVTGAGLVLFGTDNNFRAVVTNCTSSALSVSGARNVVDIVTNGNIVLTAGATDCVIRGRVGGTVTNSGSNNDLSGIKGFSGSGTVAATTNASGEVTATLNNHASLPQPNLVATCVNASAHRTVRIKSVASGVATFVVCDAAGAPVNAEAVQVRWLY